MNNKKGLKSFIAKQAIQMKHKIITKLLDQRGETSYVAQVLLVVGALIVGTVLVIFFRGYITDTIIPWLQQKTQAIFNLG